MGEAAIDVLLVDDSAVIRGAISRGLESDPQIRVIGGAANGKIALDMLDALAPRVIVLDVEMPVLSGLDALPLILAKRPGVVVIMASALTRRHAGMSLKALQLGARDYVPKPEASEGAAALAAFFEELKLKIKALGAARRASVPTVSAIRTTPRREIAVQSCNAIAIGSSTGGPTALLQIFADLKGKIATPVFITQHMPPTFTALLAEQLGQSAGVRACEGAEGALVEPRTIYVAPGGKHMLAERRGASVVLHLSDDPPEHFCKPAVDPMFRSLAKAYGAGLLGVVLTGMGRDGADGGVAIADAGGRFIVQDEASSVVYGMPGAAFRTGRASAQFSLNEIGAHLAASMGGRDDFWAGFSCAAKAIAGTQRHVSDQ